MKIVKPFTLGVLQRSYRQHGTHRMVVVALGFFALGAPATPRLLPEAAQWARLLPLLPTGQALDEVMSKASAEALVLGAACAPGGVPLTRMQVRLQVGAIDKRLAVYGDRQWRYGAVPLYGVDPPAPFSTMPLDYAHAFGGAGYAANPIGRGWDPNRLAAVAGANAGSMPNVEYAGQPVRWHAQAYPPAALGPIPIAWDARKRYAGTYDQRWLREEYPGLPADLDRRLYNQAPEDQRLAGWFAGGEAYSLEGMNAQRPVIAGTLPTFRARAFAAAAGAAPREVPLCMDTVWFLPGLELGVAAWRGETVVADSDGLDVATLMVAYEDPAAPRELAHYAEVLRLRTDPATAGLHAFNEAQLAPAVVPVAVTEAGSKAQALIAHVESSVWDGIGLAPPANHQPPQLAPPLLQPPSAAAVAAGDMDLTPLMAQVESLRQDTEREAAQQRANLQQQLGELQESLGDHAPAAPVTSPEWQDILARAEGRADEETLESMALAAPASVPDVQSTLALKAKARHASPVPVAPAQALSPALATQLGAQVRAWIAAGVPLAGRDLAGADLRGAVLAGMDLSACLLECADLRDADLRGAKLQQATLTAAQLSQADLTGADLTGANLCGSVAAAACFDGARLAQVRASQARWLSASGVGADLAGAVFDRADLSLAIFDGARLEGTVLTEAVLTGSRWQGADMNKCIAWKLQAEDADFSGSRWQRSALMACVLRGSRWNDARMTQLQGNQSDWRAADLRGVKAQRCAWPAGQLEGVDLRGAWLSSCDLSRGTLAGALLDDASFPKSLFMQAGLQGASARRTDFFQALLRKADLSGADLRDASLYQAELTEVRLQDARTEGVRLDARRTLS